MNNHTTSRYRFEDFSDGFRISSENRTTVVVRLKPTGFSVQSENGTGALFGLFEYYKMSKRIASEIMAEWEPPEGKGFTAGDSARRYASRPINDWVIRQTAGAIGKRVYGRWQKLVAGADSDVVKVQRALFAYTMKCPDVAHWEGLYTDPLVVGDIIKYRAAAYAAANVVDLAQKAVQIKLLNSTEAARLRERAKRFGAEISIRMEPRDLKGDTVLELLREWRGLFSPTGEGYRSLNRTLANMPGGISCSLLGALQTITLPRPITDRIELLFVLAFAKFTTRYRDPFDHPIDFDEPCKDRSTNLSLVMNARRNQIKKALGRVAAHTRNRLSDRRADDIGFLAQYLADYPEPHSGSVLGLADKAMRWHRDRQEERVAETLESLGADTNAAKPPIALPETTGVTFLDTVESICREGALMRHCIAGYAREAVAGYCFLFHVERGGECASVQVGRDGGVIQAHGPNNRDNAAARWGKRTLARWGRNFPEGARVEAGGVPAMFDDDLPF